MKEREYVNVNISLMVKIVKNAYHSTMMHHGVEPQQIMYMSANVSTFISS